MKFFCPVTCGCGKFCPGVGWLCVPQETQAQEGQMKPIRHFHYRPWMGLGAWSLIGVPSLPFHAPWLIVAGMAVAVAMSQSYPWGPRVFKCWDGCGHPKSEEPKQIC